MIPETGNNDVDILNNYFEIIFLNGNLNKYKISHFNL